MLVKPKPEVANAKQHTNVWDCLYRTVKLTTRKIIQHQHYFLHQVFLCRALAVVGVDVIITSCHILFPIGLDSDESYEGVSEASFKDALVFDSSCQKNNGSVPQENGIKKHRCHCIPAPHSISSACICMFVDALCLVRKLSDTS